VFAQGIANQRRPVLFRPPGGFVGSVQELLVEDNLYDFHLHSIFHSKVHNQRCNRFLYCASSLGRISSMTLLLAGANVVQAIRPAKLRSS